MIGALAALASSFTWSAGSAVYARFSREFAPTQVNFSRALVALPLFLIGAWAFEQPDGERIFAQLASGNLGWLLLSMVASYGLGDMAFFLSTRALGLPGALAIASSYPLWSAIGGYLFQGEVLAPLKVLGIGLTVSGTMLVVLVGYRHRRRGRPSGLERFEVGLSLALLTSFFWALNSFAIARGGAGLSPHVVNSVRMGIALGLCPLIGWVVHRRWAGGVPWQRLKPWSWVFLLEAYGGSFFFVYGFAHAPVGIAAALSSLSPVIAVPTAWVGRHEPVSLWKGFGVCIAVAGAVLLVQ